MCRPSLNETVSVRAPRTTWLFVRITPSPVDHDARGLALAPVEPDRPHVDDAREHACDDVRRRCRPGRLSSVGAAGAVCVTVDGLGDRASASCSPQPATARPSAATRDQRRRALTAGAGSRAARAPRHTSASSAARPSEHEAHLAPLLRLSEPGGEVLVDGVEVRLVLGREELAAGRVRDLAQRDGIGRHRPCEPAAVDDAVRRAERDRVDGDAVRLRARCALAAAAACRASGRRPRAAGSPTAACPGRPRAPSAPAAGDGRRRRSATRLEELDRAGERVADRGSLARTTVRTAAPTDRARDRASGVRRRTARTRR